TLASGTGLPAASLPLPNRLSTTTAVTTATSNGSPSSIRQASTPAVALSIATLCPVCFSKSGSKASTTPRMAPALRTLISAALAARPPIPTDSPQSNNITTVGCTPVLLGGPYATPPRWRSIYDLRAILGHFPAAG